MEMDVNHAERYTSSILEPSEIETITGLDQPAAQERLLRKLGLAVFRNKANKVILTREALVRWQLGERPGRKTKGPQVKMLRSTI